MQEITSLQNSKVQHIRKLKDKAYRKECGQYFVEGENLVKDLPFDAPVKEVFVLKSRIENYSYILSRYDDAICYAVDDKTMKAMSETVTPSGILVLVQYAEKELDLSGNIVITDGVSDPGNMGTIIRTCVACGVRQIIAVDSVDCFSGKVLRASMGGVFKINIKKLSREEAVKTVKSSVHTVYSLDMNGENIFNTEKPQGLFALAVGSESRGLSQEFRNASKVISLPMAGQMESLNAAVSLSVALYELVFNKA